MARSSSLLTLMLATSVGLCGCKPDGDQPPASTGAEAGAEAGAEHSDGPCDQAALASLAKQLDAAEPEAQVTLVASGLLAACPKALYPTVAAYLHEVAAPDEPPLRKPGLGRDEAYMAAQRRVCPEYEVLGERMSEAPPMDRGRVIYEVCGLERYGLIDESEELGDVGWFTWTTHELLLAKGTPPELAKSISRAMMLFERVTFGLSLIMLLDGQRLPSTPRSSRAAIQARRRSSSIHRALAPRPVPGRRPSSRSSSASSATT